MEINIQRNIMYVYPSTIYSTQFIPELSFTCFPEHELAQKECRVGTEIIYQYFFFPCLLSTIPFSLTSIELLTLGKDAALHEYLKVTFGDLAAKCV